MGLAGAFLLVAGPAFARPKFLVATGIETKTKEIDPGKVTCPGGECKPGSPMQIRGMMSEYTEKMEGPGATLYNGAGPGSMNCNLDERATGPCWGTWELKMSATEKWEGLWWGYFNLAAGTGSYCSVGYGQGGRLEGLQVIIDVVYPGDQPNGVVVARIYDMKQ
jgi:hypothetical protein